MTYVNDGDHSPWDARDDSSKPDAYLRLDQTKTPEGPFEPQFSGTAWCDIAVSFEFKRAASADNDHDASFKGPRRHLDVMLMRLSTLEYEASCMVDAPHYAE